MERVFDQVLGLFRFIDGKDMFEAFYQDGLSRRLLHQKSASTEHEKLLVSKLKHGRAGRKRARVSVRARACVCVCMCVCACVCACVCMCVMRG